MSQRHGPTEVPRRRLRGAHTPPRTHAHTGYSCGPRNSAAGNWSPRGCRNGARPRNHHLSPQCGKGATCESQTMGRSRPKAWWAPRGALKGVRQRTRCCCCAYGNTYVPCARTDLRRGLRLGTVPRSKPPQHKATLQTSCATKKVMEWWVVAYTRHPDSG